MEIVFLHTSRDEYSATRAAKRSMTVVELINELEKMDEDAKVIFSNDNGYTYGYVTRSSVQYDYLEEDDD